MFPPLGMFALCAMAGFVGVTADAAVEDRQGIYSPLSWRER